MSAEWRAVSKIKPDPKNVRIHDEGQVDMLRASLREFGQVWPILIRKSGKIVAHHGVYEAAIREGFDEVKVLNVEGMTDDQIRGFMLADNRLAEISTWDEDALKAELEALAELGFDSRTIGYEKTELEKLLTDEVANFRELDENLPTNHECPSCGYRWSE